MADDVSTDLTGLTVELLGAFVANNSVRADDLPKLIAATHEALAGLSASTVAADEPAEAHKPAVTSRKSLASRDFILSMIDGKPYKSLKRHLTGHGLTPEEYRTRYGLASTYPMVAPGYSDARREVAKRLGLGRKPRVESAVPAAKAKAVRRTKPKSAQAPQSGE